MRLGEIKAANPRPATPPRRDAEPASAEPATPGRALLALEPVAPAQEPRRHERQPQFRQAPFLAQLIATKDQHPQTRERRRAEPQEALASYRATVALLERLADQ